jgi:hypothetical protein
MAFGFFSERGEGFMKIHICGQELFHIYKDRRESSAQDGTAPAAPPRSRLRALLPDIPKISVTRRSRAAPAAIGPRSNAELPTTARATQPHLQRTGLTGPSTPGLVDSTPEVGTQNPAQVAPNHLASVSLSSGDIGLDVDTLLQNARRNAGDVELASPPGEGQEECATVSARRNRAIKGAQGRPPRPGERLSDEGLSRGIERPSPGHNLSPSSPGASLDGRDVPERDASGRIPSRPASKHDSFVEGDHPLSLLQDSALEEEVPAISVRPATPLGPEGVASVVADFAEPLSRVPRTALGSESINRLVPAGRKQAVLDAMPGIAEQLDDGPVFLGEQHTRPDTRALLVDLMKAGRVNELFLELGSLELEDLGIDADPSGHVRTVTDHLRGHTGRTPSDDSVFGAFEMGMGYVDIHKNEISLSALIKEAQKAGVRVYRFDNEPGRDRTSAAAMERRNAHARTEFERSQSAAQVGTVLLVGADHLKPEKCGNGMTIQRACGVEDGRVHDLSDL